MYSTYQLYVFWPTTWGVFFFIRSPAGRDQKRGDENDVSTPVLEREIATLAT